MSNAFSIKECLAFGWRTFKAHPWVFVKVAIAYVVIQLLLGFVQAVLPEFVSPLVGIVVGTFLGIGVISFYLKAHDAPQSASVRDLWRPEPFWRYLVTSVVAGVIIMIGFFLLVVPGIILALAWSFALYLVIERKMWTLEALKESARITRGSRVKLFLLGLVIAAANVVGALLLLIGLIVTVPVTVLASVHAYRTLAAKPAEAAEAAPAIEAPEAPAPAPAA